MRVRTEAETNDDKSSQSKRYVSAEQCKRKLLVALTSGRSSIEVESLVRKEKSLSRCCYNSHSGGSHNL